PHPPPHPPSFPTRRSSDLVVVVSESALARLPTLSRDFADLAILSPHVAPRPLGGVSIGGQNQMYNAIRIDGGENADQYYGREPGDRKSTRLNSSHVSISYA